MESTLPSGVAKKAIFIDTDGTSFLSQLKRLPKVAVETYKEISWDNMHGKTVAFAPIYAIGTLVFSAALLANRAFFDIVSKVSKKTLVYCLKRRGFAVSTIHNFDGNWQEVSNLLSTSSNENSTSFISFNGHGNIVDGENYIYGKKEGAHVGEISATELLTIIKPIAGRKILAISACKAGGFTNKACAIRDENLIVVTSSDQKTCTNKQAAQLNRDMVRAIRSNSPIHNEFLRRLRKNECMPKKFVSYTPKIFVGRHMQQLKM